MSEFMSTCGPAPATSAQSTSSLQALFKELDQTCHLLSEKVWASTGTALCGARTSDRAPSSFASQASSPSKLRLLADAQQLRREALALLGGRLPSFDQGCGSRLPAIATHRVDICHATAVQSVRQQAEVKSGPANTSQQPPTQQPISATADHLPQPLPPPAACAARTAAQPADLAGTQAPAAQGVHSHPPTCCKPTAPVKPPVVVEKASWLGQLPSYHGGALEDILEADLEAEYEALQVCVGGTRLSGLLSEPV